jgi:hypothetical protein
MEVSGQLYTVAALPLGKEPAPATYWIGGWMGPRAALDAVEKKTIFCSCHELNPDYLVMHTTAQPLQYS